MPKRASDDIDHAPIDPKPSRKPRKPLPDQWDLLHFGSLPCSCCTLSGVFYHLVEKLICLLISASKTSTPYFRLFFSDEIFQNFADNTNSYADSHQPTEGDHTRKWRPTIMEMRA